MSECKKLSEDIWPLVHAFSDRERKDAVRALARRAEMLESQLATATSAARAAALKIKALHEALNEACDFAKEGWAYASPYFREKWDYENRIADLCALASTQPVEAPASVCLGCGKRTEDFDGICIECRRERKDG